MSKRATEALLAQIHEEVAKAMLKTLQEGEPSVGQISNIIRFLKDNGIEAQPEEGSNLQKIVDALPDFNNDENEFTTLQ